MSVRFYELAGVRIVECAAEGPPLRTARDGLDLMEQAIEHRARMIVIPVSRLDDDFFRLRTGIAGELLQKFVNYRWRLAIVGDISRYVSASTPLRDFVRESNRGTQIWFVADADELVMRLAGSTSQDIED